MDGVCNKVDMSIIRQNDTFNVLEHRLFTRPMLGEHGVFLLYITCTGRKSPTKDPQKTAVIWHLSLTPITSTLLAPCCSMVHIEHGTILIPV